MAEDEALAGIDDQDPASVERLMKRMGDYMGEDVGDEMSQTLDSSGETEPDMGDSDPY
jgi:hypothetical protein